MSKLLDLADRGDAATARFAERHLKQTPEARERRERAKAILVGLSKAALIGVVLTGLYKGLDLSLDVAVEHIEHVEEVGDEYLNLPNGGGMDTLDP